MLRKTVTLSCLLILPLLILFSCTANSGRLTENPSLMELHRNQNPLPDYNYYYVGRANLPYAVIGLDKRYQFNTKGWFKIENKTDVSQKISRLDNRPGIGVSDTVFPADIQDKQGTRVGIWFSYYKSTVVTIDHDARTIVVLNPYSPNGDFGDG